LFEPSSRDLFPAFEQIPSIIPHGDGHFSTAKPFSPTPADVYFGRGQTILLQRERIKRQTIAQRRLQYQRQAA